MAIGSRTQILIMPTAGSMVARSASTRLPSVALAAAVVVATAAAAVAVVVCHRHETVIVKSRQ
jgi:hypothetical protein